MFLRRNGKSQYAGWQAMSQVRTDANLAMPRRRDVVAHSFGRKFPPRETNIAAVAAATFHSKLLLLGVRAGAYKGAASLVVYENDILRARVTNVAKNDVDWWSFEAIPTSNISSIREDQAVTVNIIGQVQDVVEKSITIVDGAGGSVSVHLGSEAQDLEFQGRKIYCFHRLRVHE
eukprot:6321020-Amphidinium_carterae.2